MTNAEIAHYLRCDLFADRETVEDARDYAFDVLRRLEPDDRIAAYTAMMVLNNTIAKQIEQNEASR
jgi:hypothetical protein